MEYTVKKMAELSGVSTRTLRYYDQIGLLKPARVAENGYRMYGTKEVDLLQQILFYRELGVELDKVKKILAAPDFDKEQALKGHLAVLLQKRKQIDKLIWNVNKTISTMKGETTMGSKEKFEGFKRKMTEENEAKYGKEIREKYGDAIVDASNKKVMGMTEDAWQKAEALRTELEGLLKEAFLKGDPAGEEAQRVCDLHRQWISLFWKDGMYSGEAHKGLGEIYASDERFRKYYDNIAPGCAEFLRDSLNIYCG